MVWNSEHSAGAPRHVWALASAQHGVVSRDQLLERGVSRRAIEHRLAIGRLHRVMPGVYAVGRREIDRRGRWMGAVLACGPTALLSHWSAAELLGIGREKKAIEVSVRTCSDRRRAVEGLRVHRRPKMRDEQFTRRYGIPLTAPTCTLVDLAVRCGRDELERLINEADRLDLLDPETFRSALGAYRGQRGVARLRLALDRRTFRMTRSQLERRFLPLADRAGLPVPLTRQWVNGYEVDFYWPDLGFVVETDGLRYHRTPAQQTRDRLRDQAHTASGLAHLRFTHEQIRFAPAYVVSTLQATVEVIDRARRPVGGGAP